MTIRGSAGMNRLWIGSLHLTQITHLMARAPAKSTMSESVSLEQASFEVEAGRIEDCLSGPD